MQLFDQISTPVRIRRKKNFRLHENETAFLCLLLEDLFNDRQWFASMYAVSPKMYPIYSWFCFRVDESFVRGFAAKLRRPYGTQSYFFCDANKSGYHFIIIFHSIRWYLCTFSVVSSSYRQKFRGKYRITVLYEKKKFKQTFIYS